MQTGLRLLLCGAVLAWGALAVFVAWGQAFAGAAPDMVLRFAPHQPAALLARIEAREPGSPQDPEVLSALLTAAPLSAAPFTLTAEGAVSRSDWPAAEALLAEAVRRDPRSVRTRALAAYAALAQNKAAEAMPQLERLLILDHERSDVYLQAVAEAAATPEGRAWLLAHADDEGSRTIPRISLYLNEVSRDYDLLLRLNAGRPYGQGELLERILALEGPTAAFLAWRSLGTSEDVAQGFSWPFNAALTEIPAPPPFNWREAPNLVTRDSRPGVSVSYDGRGETRLLHQVTLIRAGTYQLRSAISGNATERGGALLWRVACWGSGAVLGETAPAGARTALETVTMQFTIPDQGCDAQIVTLLGRPGEFPIRMRGRVSHVEIRPAPAGDAPSAPSQAQP